MIDSVFVSFAYHEHLVGTTKCDILIVEMNIMYVILFLFDG